MRNMSCVARRAAVAEACSILAAALVVVACHSGETPESRYKSRAAAVSAGAVSRGWVPEALPSSAVDIVESHDIDSNETWIKFRFSESERAVVETMCVPAVGAPSLSLRHAPVWWPSSLSERTTNDYRLFDCSRSRDNAALTRLAVSRSEPTAFYWTAAR
jgi:hypothetical protein